MTEAAFGVQLRQSRQAAALSLRQLATRVGYDHSYLSQIERGRRPGSAHLARLCDRELGTSPALSTAYEQTHPPAPPEVTDDPGSGAELPDGGTLLSETMPASSRLPAGVELLETVRHQLAGSFGPGREVAEWRAVATGHAHDFATTPPAERLPELTADLQLLRAGAAAGSAALAVPSAELAVMIALTLAELGRLRAAERWWRTARATADSSAERRIASLARSCEATSGLAEHRPLEGLLELADDALLLADRPADVARALAARARVLAAQGEAAQAQQAVQDLRTVTIDLPGRSAVSDSPFEWAGVETPAVEGRVCAALGDTLGAYVALDQALGLWSLEMTARAELELVVACCLVMDGDVAAGLAVAMRVLVELPDQWHTHHLYDAAGHVLAAVRGDEAGRAGLWDYQALLRRRPFDNRTVGSQSSSTRQQG
ncbi:helix-turn-helix domain-containing protein [Kribbella sp. CA-293567]|uniref:helix-turn-helix domain-containing protein n=1 Tax=Kribbella sp. CA-293567 TaxID=3002436 RepID=UPI0022DD1754|nr:helix-turn-helix transcriptional regulator [Kribbella sp. CA-293567]WBQ07130.1 helix-turn-helix transcriptional regulator [Kribbella sp. CA-293567]